MIYTGDCLEILPTLEAESVHCCVTSPPYWGLRDYGLPPSIWDGDPACEHEWGDMMPAHHPGQVQDNKAVHPENAIGQNKGSGSFCQLCGAWRGCFGLEPTPELYVQHSVQVFREIRRVLRDDGTLWLNLGDSYASGKGTCYNPGGGESSLGNTTNPGKNKKQAGAYPLDRGNKSTLEASGLKPKDLVGIPWRVAFALQADGWYLRSDIIWAKPNPMPESVKDRCCKSHEYVFLLTKSAKYYFDGEAIKEDATGYDRSQGMGQEIQSDGQSESDFAKILLLREGASNKEGISGVPFADGRTEGTLPESQQVTRTGREIQDSDETIPAESERERTEGGGGQQIPKHGQRTFFQAQDRNKAETSNQDNGLHFDERSMEGNQGCSQSLLCVLPQENGTAGNGSCNPVVEGRISHEGQYSSGLSEVQRIKGSKNITGNMSERGVTRTTEGLNLKTAEEKCHGGKRTRRSVWTITTRPFKEAHFATFPPEIPEICIKAGTSERGCCPECGSPWERVVERKTSTQGQKEGYTRDCTGRNDGDRAGSWTDAESITTGWRPTCVCHRNDLPLPPIPCTVLDPFSGAATTGNVAERLGREYIGIELNPAYSDMGEKRIEAARLPLFGESVLFSEAANGS